MVIWVIALVIVAIVGPVAGYFYASSRRGRSTSESDRRIRELEDEVRRQRGAPNAAPKTIPAPSPHFPPLPPPPGPIGGDPTAHAAPRPTPQGNFGPAAPTHASDAGNRFAHEPPLFGDERGAAPAWPQPQQQPQRVLSVPPSQEQPPAETRAESPDPTAADEAIGDAHISDATPAPPKLPAPSGDGSAAPQPASPEPETREFKPVSDMIDDADAEELEWLGHLTVGRRVRLKKLGYDAPAKLANLRRSEIRRLARELDVSELDIRDRWMPAAVQRLKRQERT